MEVKLTELEQRMMDKLKSGPVRATQLRSWEKTSTVRLTKKCGANGIPLVLERIMDDPTAPVGPEGWNQRRAWVANNGSFVFRDGAWHKVETQPHPNSPAQRIKDFNQGIW